MLLARVVETSERVAATSKRLEKVEHLAGLLRQTPPDEVETVAAFLSGVVRQARLGIGYATLRDSTCQPAEAASLQVPEVDRTLLAISEISGARADSRRRQLLSGLYARATRDEQRFLTKLLLGEVRQGALEGVMLDALSKAAGVETERLRRAAMMAGGVVRIAEPLLRSGPAALDRYGVALFTPVEPMLAQTAESPADALAALGRASFEFKLDGARIQVHRSGSDVRVFSRRLNEVTQAVPEVVEAALALPIREAILDGEVISFTPEGRPQPFQVTARRFGRKLDLERLRTELPLTPVWFDLIYADGSSLIDEPQHRRFGALKELARAEHLVPNLTAEAPDQAEDFFFEALRRGHEGVMAKAVESAYAAGARGQSWLKIKKAHTLDLVVLAAEWGNGRREGWLSNLHLGARDTERGGFAMLGKTFKGMTDDMLRWQTQHFLSIETGRDAYTVFVRPSLVVEIAFNDIQVSPRYERGLALRFARVKRYRTDKTAEEADTLENVRRIAGLSVDTSLR